MWILIIAIVALILYFVLRKNFKVPTFGSLCVTTGGLKAGKSTFSLHLAKRTYKRNLRVVRFRNWCRKVLNKLFKKEYELEEEPLFYSTIPVAFPHVRITLDLIMRKKRFAYKSVVWIDEATLLADSQLYKDIELNSKLLQWCKMFGHMTKGGCCFFTSHCVSELHISMRRVASEYFYVHSTYKWLPFFLVATVREERYSEDGTVVNNYDSDITDSLKRVLIPKKVWKDFDCYCYSIMTDDLPVEKTIVKSDYLKCDRVVSFSPYHRFEKEKLEKVGEENAEKAS